MRFLVLGGTSFVGRAIVDELIARGHEVTLFGRGRTNPDLFPQLDRRIGDRKSGDYTALARGDWDAVIDVSAYVPRHVQQAMDAVDGRFRRYLFISTVSVYDIARAPKVFDEDCPRLAPRRDTETIDDQSYGPLKVACEDDVRQRLGERATIVRPGIVAGPHDPTDRFTYWVRQGTHGGRIEVPGRLEQPIQVVDSQDLAVLVANLVERDQMGTYNAVGESVSFEDMIRACATGTVELVSVPEGNAPMLLADPADDVLFTRSAARALAAGMPRTPISETAEKVRQWDLSRS